MIYNITEYMRGREEISRVKFIYFQIASHNLSFVNDEAGMLTKLVIILNEKLHKIYNDMNINTKFIEIYYQQKSLYLA